MDFKDFKLSIPDQLYLGSVAVPRYVRNTGETPCQIWFEVFIEHVERLGFKVVKVDETVIKRDGENVK